MLALVTGCRGFIGRHLARQLAAAGHKVVGIGHGAWPQHEHAAWGVAEWSNADITRTNLDTVASALGRVDVVFHLAGGSSVAPSIAMPAEDFRRSVGSTLEVLEWVRTQQARAPVVLASSAAVYGDAYVDPVRTREIPQPKSPYGHHKWMSEQLVRSYSGTFGVAASVVRLFSVYGPELRKQLLWDACQRLEASTSPLALAGTGDELRDWLHVSDAARVLHHAASLASSECPTIHGATGVPVSVRDIGDALCAAFGRRDRAVFSGKVRAGDPLRLVSHPADVPDVGPLMPWTQGVADYVGWFRRDRGRDAR